MAQIGTEKKIYEAPAPPDVPIPLTLPEQEPVAPEREREKVPA